MPLYFTVSKMVLNKSNSTKGEENSDNLTDYLLNNIDIYKWLTGQIPSIHDALLSNLKESISDLNSKRSKLNEAISGIQNAVDELKWIWDKISMQEIDQLESINNSLKIKKLWEDKKLFLMAQKEYQWWFSAAIFNYPKMIGYVISHDGVLGWMYAQSLFRTKELDEYIEEKMRERGLNDWEIAVYLFSKACRWHFEQYNDNEESAKTAEYAKDYRGPKFQWTVKEKKKIIDDKITLMCEAAKLEEI
jgi:hypothetical protein